MKRKLMIMLIKTLQKLIQKMESWTPDSTYRPYETADEILDDLKIRGDWVKGSRGVLYKMASISDSGTIRYGTSACQAYSFVNAFKKITYADGTPFGKKLNNLK